MSTIQHPVLRLQILVRLDGRICWRIVLINSSNRNFKTQFRLQFINFRFVWDSAFLYDLSSFCILLLNFPPVIFMYFNTWCWKKLTIIQNCSFLFKIFFMGKQPKKSTRELDMRGSKFNLQRQKISSYFANPNSS